MRETPNKTEQMKKNRLTILLLTFATLLAMSSCSPLFYKTKSVAIFGDSYSTFEGWLTPDTNAIWYFTQPDKGNDVHKVEQTWWHQLMQDKHYKLCINNSYSGSTVSYKGYRGEDYKSRSFVTRCDNLDNPDIILLFAGTNDSWVPVPAGEYVWENPTEEDLYTFRPALALLLKRMKELYPKADIRYMLNSELREGINESVYTICARYDIPVITLHDIDKQKGHPSIVGMQAIAEQVKEALK